jgi:hypothetical protein
MIGNMISRWTDQTFSFQTVKNEQKQRSEIQGRTPRMLKKGWEKFFCLF